MFHSKALPYSLQLLEGAPLLLLELLPDVDCRQAGRHATHRRRCSLYWCRWSVHRLFDHFLLFFNLHVLNSRAD